MGWAACRCRPRRDTALTAYDWPGNVRELRHALESAALRIAGTSIELEDLAGSMQLPDLTEPVARAKRSLDANQPIDLEKVERLLLQQALQQTAGNVSAAARLLSIGREAMRYRMAKFGLDDGKDETGSD